MSNLPPLTIPKKEKIAGLHAYCSKCDRLISAGKCGETKKKIYTCKFTESHKYKAFVEIPGCATRKKRSRTFDTRDLKEAITLKIEFEQELKANDYQITDVLTLKKEAKRELIIEYMAKYVAFQNNVNVPKQKQKKRSKPHVEDIKRSLLFFCESMKIAGIDHTILPVTSINDRAVELFHDYLREVRKHGNRSYNKNMAALRRFMTWTIKQCNIKMVNPFEGVTPLPVPKNNEIIEPNEFYDLLEVVIPENGMKTLESGKRKTMYKDWMKDAFRVALETGLRREEYMNIRFCDIMEDQNGTPQFVKVENYKVNRKKGIEEKDSKQYKLAPVTGSLQKLILDKGYSKYKGTNRYLLGGNEKASRKTLFEMVSEAFTHFWKQSGHNRKITLKHLRKTYLTALANHFGDHANLISDHADMKVLKEHYLNNKKLLEQAGTFSVFD